MWRTSGLGRVATKYVDISLTKRTALEVCSSAVRRDGIHRRAGPVRESVRLVFAAPGTPVAHEGDLFAV